jgi:hypothetical protein
MEKSFEELESESREMEHNRKRGIHTFSGSAGVFTAAADIYKHIWNECHIRLKDPADLPKFTGAGVVRCDSSMGAFVEDVTAEPGNECPHCTGYKD